MRQPTEEERLAGGRRVADELLLITLSALMVAALCLLLLNRPWKGAGAVVGLTAGMALFVWRIAAGEDGLRLVAARDEEFRVRLGVQLVVYEAGIWLLVLLFLYPWAMGRSSSGMLRPLLAGGGVLVWGSLRLFMRGVGLNPLALAMGRDAWAPVEIVPVEEAARRRSEEIEIVESGKFPAAPESVPPEEP